MTYRQLVYLILDEIKLISGDSIINEDHVVFIANKYRPYLLKQYYEKELEKDVADQNYQEICLDLTEVPAVNGSSCEGGSYLRSTKKVPKLMNIGSSVVSPIDYYQGVNIAWVSRNRMRFVGNNKWMKNIIYCSIGPDRYMYFKSNNPQFRFLSKAKFTAVFEDAEEAAALSCCDSSDDTSSCDILDKEFPFEDFLFPQLMDLVLKEVLGAAYRPADTTNNDSDDLADLATYISRNAKSNLSKQIDGSAS